MRQATKNFTKTTFLTLAGSALLVSVASAQPWQDQQATTTRTTTTYTRTQDVPPPPPPPVEETHTTRTVTTYSTDNNVPPPPPPGYQGGYRDHDGPPPPPPGQLGPRVGQVDQRINQLNWRVGHMVRQGAITRNQGDWYHQQILNVQQQEQVYTTRNYGHLSDWQQRQLNQKLDRISRKLDRYAY